MSTDKPLTTEQAERLIHAEMLRHHINPHTYPREVINRAVRELIISSQPDVEA